MMACRLWVHLYHSQSIFTFGHVRRDTTQITPGSLEDLPAEEKQHVLRFSNQGIPVDKKMATDISDPNPKTYTRSTNPVPHHSPEGLKVIIEKIHTEWRKL